MNSSASIVTYLQINQANEHYCAPDWNWHPGNFQDLDIWLVCAGRGTAQVDGKGYRLSRGSCFLFRPGVNGVIEHDPEHPFQVLAIHFQGLSGELPKLYRPVEDMELMETLLQRLLTNYHRGTMDSAIIWLAAALEVIRDADEKGMYAEYRSHSRDLRISKLQDEIRRRPDYPWLVEELADRAGISPDHFSRIFKAKTGVTPNHFILAARIDKAKQLLSSSSHPIERVAELCGYNSPQFFSRQFREKTGCPPSFFRK